MDFEQEYSVGNPTGRSGTGTRSSSTSWSDLPWSAFGSGLGQIAGGITSGKGGAAARDLAYANAAAQLELAGENAARVGQIAGINAAATRRVGYAQADADRKSAIMTGQLMMIEGVEAFRRETNEAKYHVGLLRVMQSPSGWQLNTGTPRAVLEGRRTELKKQLEYSKLQKEMSLFAMLMNTELQATVTEYAADQSADAMLMSAAIEQEIMLAEANARYDAMIREGDYYYRLGRQRKRSGLFGGLGTIAGGVIGFVATGGNPAGAMAGAQIGGAAGGALA